VRTIAPALAALLALAAAPGAASAQDLREFCPDRPGLGTPACTIDKGHLAVELGLLDWTRDREAGSRTDTIVAGDLLVRYGLSDRIEAQVGWQAVGHLRERDPSGSVDRATGTGDVRLALRGNLLNPDGSLLSVAVMPFVTLPTGGDAIGAGDWTAGVLLPVSFALPNDVQLAFTGEIDAAADETGGGHHLAYGGIVGIDTPLGHDVSATVELAAKRDDERGQRRSELLSGLSLGWSASDSLQLDAGANVGLNGPAPDLELYVGIARRF
jgi:hypothetical protein